MKRLFNTMVFMMMVVTSFFSRCFSLPSFILNCLPLNMFLSAVNKNDFAEWKCSSFFCLLFFSFWRTFPHLYRDLLQYSFLYTTVILMINFFLSLVLFCCEFTTSFKVQLVGHHNHFCPELLLCSMADSS